MLTLPTWYRAQLHSVTWQASSHLNASDPQAGLLFSEKKGEAIVELFLLEQPTFVKAIGEDKWSEQSHEMQAAVNLPEQQFMFFESAWNRQWVLGKLKHAQIVRLVTKRVF